MPAAIRLDVDAQQPDRLDLEPRLLAELAPQPIRRALRLVQEATGEVPEVTPRLTSAAGEQHAAVALQDPLHARDRVGPELLATVRTDQVVLDRSEIAAAAGTEAPVVECAHRAT